MKKNVMMTEQML